MEYKIITSETIRKTHVVNAENEEEAKKIYDNGELYPVAIENCAFNIAVEPVEQRKEFFVKVIETEVNVYSVLAYTKEEAAERWEYDGDIVNDLDYDSTFIACSEDYYEARDAKI